MMILALLGLMYARVIMHTCRLAQGIVTRISPDMAHIDLGEWVESNVEQLLKVQQEQESEASKVLAKFFLSSVRTTLQSQEEAPSRSIAGWFLASVHGLQSAFLTYSSFLTYSEIYCELQNPADEKAKHLQALRTQTGTLLHSFKVISAPL
jgi:hypothetical protein